MNNMCLEHSTIFLNDVNAVTPEGKNVIDVRKLLLWFNNNY